MHDMTRRRLFTSAGAATAALAAEVLPGSVHRALASGPSHGSGRLSDIRHVVILMQENRSFDHYFGTMPGVRGFSDPTAITLSTGRSVFHQPVQASAPAGTTQYANPDGYLLPFHLDTRTTSAQAAPSISHGWTVQHAAWNNGAMDRWVPAHITADGARGPYTMGYYTRQDIPFHWALAENFTICDNYHCSVMGPTWPNRLMHMSAWVDPRGEHGGPVWSNAGPEPYTWKTYPEALTDAGVSWQVYQEASNGSELNMLDLFKVFQESGPASALFNSGIRRSGHGQFEWDAAHDRLPVVSWLMPATYQSEHPGYLPAAGADYIASKIDAIAANPDVWAKTVFILNYDENDGQFDHVPPPTPPPGTPDEFIQVPGAPDWPIGGGFRVPCIIVSPWTQGGWIASEAFDHTSVLRFLEVITGVTIPNITPWRRQAFGDLTSAFGFPEFPSAARRLPSTKSTLVRAVTNVNTLPAQAFPGAGQAEPKQEHGPRPRRRAIAPGFTARDLTEGQ
jgi:phospholipase C